MTWQSQNGMMENQIDHIVILLHNMQQRLHKLEAVEELMETQTTVWCVLNLVQRLHYTEEVGGNRAAYRYEKIKEKCWV